MRASLPALLIALAFPAPAAAQAVVRNERSELEASETLRHSVNGQ
jgi:hypothetical protein